MHTNRKGALFLLAVMFLVTMMPASACLLTMQPIKHHSCCDQMVQMCGAGGMHANGSCCRAPRQNAAVAPVSPYSPEHVQRLALAPHPAIVPVAAAAVKYWSALEAPPPKFRSGHTSILRV